MIIMPQFLKKRSALMAGREGVIFIQKELTAFSQINFNNLSSTFMQNSLLTFFFLAQIIYESQPVS
jgi:hypothetical protein